MEIKLIRNQGCHIWQTAERVLKEALAEVGPPVFDPELRPEWAGGLEYEIVVVGNDSEAEQYKFFGSPQITIDGVDVDPMAQKMGQYKTEGCRIYMWQGKMYEYPPKEMIIAKLKFIQNL